jgi:hypothetical protein
MTPSAFRLASFIAVLAAFAASPAAARPGGGGGGHFGGGGARAFSAPAAPHFAAPHISAPRISAPHFSAPRISVPHFAAPRMPTPHFAAPRIPAQRIIPQIARPSIAMPRIAPQRLAAPVLGAQHPLTTGALPAARAFAGTAQRLQNVPPGGQANRAFALAGPHAAVGTHLLRNGAHVLRNPFFANRPGLTRATFSGRFAKFPFRHHRHFRPIVIGWFGPLFWPYGYDDFLDYAFDPYAYDSFWPYAYDDVYDGMFGLYDTGIRAAYAATGRPLPPSGGRVLGGTICSGQTAGLTDWQIEEIAQAVEPDDTQRAALDELKAASARALVILRDACPNELASTPTGRILAMQARLSSMLEAVRTVHVPLAKFYELLNDEQKARFNALGANEDQNESQARRDLTQACGERAAGIAAIPIERIERAVRPDETQRSVLAELQNAISQAGEMLSSNCPTYRPLTPVVRLDAMEQRLDAMLRAVEKVQPALSRFYGSLTDEQKERFNRLPPSQS